MPTSRTYGDACGIARALDVVGERWALLVVRELILGPQRFSDLRRALPGVSSNMLTDRLRELESHGVVQQRRLPPPAASVVYDLTDSGRELEPIVLALGGWGLRVPLPPAPVHLSATSVLLFLRGSLRPNPQAAVATYRFELTNQVWTVRTQDGQVHIEPGEPAHPHAGLRTDPATLNSLLDGSTSLATALTNGAANLTGDESALRWLLGAVTP
ncbi:winged helix-turn-helix transcriptional regulator [Micromonospora sp. LH3U1]|uniref:winged helix-turn-helix transcriptional regulator n=1 Tax=Micromonospora sp. LH3U1 TaxID=3018339 RepID=UPI002349ED34|nr:winged helix-turn-helix transcriptional regulator [Micromonospora sp. LH3U1]WCN78603.1 winged helix-turn-helix transcriptional regulator [Micromonospora sp. LH3U1]